MCTDMCIDMCMVQRAGNYSEAMLWFTRAADQGRVKSKYKLAQLCELGGNGVEQVSWL